MAEKAALEAKPAELRQEVVRRMLMGGGHDTQGKEKAAALAAGWTESEEGQE